MTPLPVVRVDLGARSYDVVVGRGATAEVGRRIAGLADAPGRIFVVADERVADLHGADAIASLGGEAAVASLVRMPSGEAAKTLGEVERVARALVDGGLERGDLVVGLGGGAATDVAGFVASVALRGVRWAALPTTLLAQVDASVGGKTGVNLPEGKNLVGAFHQPVVVGCDVSRLATLPDREHRAGLAEVVKTAWIGDAALLESLEAHPPTTVEHPSLPDVVRRCVAVKAAIVSADEREGGRRAVLNFGHTLGHAIETEGEGRFLHGEAVALGLVAAVWLSVETGRCPAAALERMIGLLDRLGLPTREPGLDPDAVVARTRTDKKRAGGRDRYQLTRGVGLVSVASDLPEGAPRAAVQFLRR